MTQATDQWLPADDQAKLIVVQRRQRIASGTTNSSGHLAATTDAPIRLVDFRPRPRDVTGHVIAADKDGGHVNTAYDEG